MFFVLIRHFTHFGSITIFITLKKSKIVKFDCIVLKKNNILLSLCTNN